jgi:arginase
VPLHSTSDMPAVDSPEPGGPTIKEVVKRLTPLVCHPRARGLELTSYDPGLDPDRSCVAGLVKLLENLLVGTCSSGMRTA